MTHEKYQLHCRRDVLPGVAGTRPGARQQRPRAEGDRRLVHHRLLADVGRHTMHPAVRAWTSDGVRPAAAARHTMRLRLPRKPRDLEEILRQESPAALSRLLRHADARAGVRAGRRFARRHAERTRPAPGDERHALRLRRGRRRSLRSRRGSRGRRGSACPRRRHPPLFALRSLCALERCSPCVLSAYRAHRRPLCESGNRR